MVSPGHRIDLTEEEHITFLLPQSGRLDIRVRGAEFRVQPGRLAAFRPTERSTRATPDSRGRFQAAALMVPMAALSALASRLGFGGTPGFPRDGVNLAGPAGRYMALNLARLADDLLTRPSATLPGRARDEIVILIEELLAEIMGAEADRTASRRVLPALHRVRLAEEILHAEADDPLSMLDLADRLEVGLRSLQMAFRDIHGRGPREVLQDIRLHRAQCRLLAARGAAQVTTVAMDSGFFHLGRFAQSYVRAFGEKPSETLARSGTMRPAPAQGQVRAPSPPKP